ncbi:protein naked cuticle homolog isoform X2 [Venturia canescens]|uniref:protein naked cuticle homolog isoform X2 n=1 Tax=Venturia canescens TaxID=32260 RepID=UPI001C9BCFE4|nr:protein naked cuticle homolog isoform X2 [Venturia canescens]
MATGLVKWWRARFLAGYKPFSVVGGTADGSDSEELLACVAPPCNSSPLPPRILITPEPILQNGGNPIQTGTSTTTTPQTANDETNNSNNVGNPTRQLSFEEFECDVSVAEGDRRRQEFSFTLYDFDGHGKITKDDIAGLVTTIYDTLGASIQVPPCGSKTIKVKLTVSPDQRGTSLGSSSTQQQQQQQQQQTNNNGGATGVTTTGTKAATGASTTTATGTATISNASVKTTHLPGGNVANGIATASSSCCHVKHVSSCSHGNHHSRRAPRRRRALRTRPEPERVVESHSDEDGDNVPAGLTMVNGAATTTGVTPSPTKQEELRRRVGPVAHMPASPYSNSSEGDVSDESDASPTISPLTPLVTNQRKRSGSMQRQQLLEIIQANMEKNNLSFHASRKRHQSEQLRIPVQSPYVVEPTSPPYIEERCKPSLLNRQGTAAYHKPVREHHHHHHPHQHPIVSLSKLPVKCRSGGNVRKQRGHNSSPRSAPPQSLRNNLQQATIEDNVNINSSPMRNNLEQQPLILNPTANINNHINNQHNETHYVQSQQSGKPGKKHQLKHETREQDQARAMAQVVRWLEREFSQNSAVASSAGRRHVHKHIHHHYHHYHAEALV